MRILFLGAFKSPGFRAIHPEPMDGSIGGQRKMELVLRALCDGGNEVRVISSAVPVVSRGAWERRRNEVVRYPEGCVDLDQPATPGWKPWGGLGMGWAVPGAVRNLVKRWRPDAAIAYNALWAEARGLLACARSGVPYLLMLDDLPSARSRGWNPKPWFDRVVEPGAFARAAGFTFVNSAIAQRVEHRGRPGWLLPGVIDTPLLAAVAARVPPFRQHPRVLVYSGGLNPERGAGELLESLGALPAGWRVEVCGSGRLAPGFEEAARRNPERVHFHGMLSGDRLYSLLARADAVINTRERLAERAGVFPFRMFEYVVSGAHVISVPLPPLDGVDLSWCQRWDGSPGTLPRILETAEADFQRDAMARAESCRWVVERYGLDAVGEALSRILGDVVNRRGEGLFSSANGVAS